LWRAFNNDLHGLGGKFALLTMNYLVGTKSLGFN